VLRGFGAGDGSREGRRALDRLPDRIRRRFLHR
jgi:hypothetical protein